MTIASTASGAGGRQAIGAFRAAPGLIGLSLILLLAVAAQMHWGVNTDTSWNITLAEKTLDGQRPNIDFIEINPPLSFLLYLPPTLAARWTGATPEFMVDLFCFGFAALSLGLSQIILSRARLIPSGAGDRLAAIAAAAIVLLPMRAFNEREHIALMAALPCLAALAVWASQGRVAPMLSLLAGLGAGLAMAIKPHFALFFLPNIVYLAARVGWRGALSRIEPWAALATFALYWGAVLLWCPAFLARAAPIARDLYLPYRKPLATMAHDPTLILWIALAVLFLVGARKRWSEPRFAVPALASLGAIAAYLAQGKLWPYQGYPALALAALAVAPLALENLAPPPGARIAASHVALAVVSALALSIAGFWYSLGPADPAPLERAVASIAPHPRILAISPDIATGHPLTRRVEGVWVGSLMSLWITQMSEAALKRNPSAEEAGRYQDYLRFDRQTLVADIVGKKPDAILVADATWLAWAQANADVAAALAAYHPRETVGEVTVLARNDAR